MVHLRRMRKENDPGITDEVVEVDRSVGGVSGEGRCDRT